MWLTVLSVASAFVAVQGTGMCFGVRFLQKQVTCPETMVYNPQLCICIEPQHKIRLYGDINFIQEVPNTLVRSALYPSDPRQIYRQRLLALQHRLAAHLPDTSFHSYDSSATGAAAPIPLLLHPDRFYQNQPKTTAIDMKFSPKQWKIGGLQEYWRHGKSDTSLMPKWIPRTLGVANQVQPLSFIDRLKQVRKTWQEAALRQARSRLGNQALAQKFFDNLTTSGISPDTSRANKQTIDSIAPDSLRGEFYKSPTEQVKKPLLKLKEAALRKQGLGNILSRPTARQANSFIRSVMRLNSS